MYKLVVIILLTLFASFSFCQVENTLSDINEISPEVYKMNRKKFMAEYGSDDTNKVLIHLFFRKRKNGFIKASLFPISSFMVGLDIFNGIETGNFQLPDDLPIFYPLLILNIHGIYLVNKFNRRVLYQIISDRNSGTSISPYTLQLYEKEKFRMESRRSKKEYLEFYKSDKNKIELIEKYFTKRAEAQRKMLLFPGSIALTVLIMQLEFASQRGGDNYKSPISESIFKFIVPVSLGISIYGLYNSVQYTKKRLYCKLI